MNHRKPYASAEEARRSKDVLVNGHEVAEGCPCGSVHTEAPVKSRTATGPRTPVRARQRDTGPSAETRAMVYARDLGCCVRCGVAVKDIPHSCHHRILRSHGVSNDFEVLLTMCGSGVTGCHGWTHAHPLEAADLGYLVRSGVGDESNPLLVPVLYATPDGLKRQYLTDDGDRVGELPEPMDGAA